MKNISSILAVLAFSLLTFLASRASAADPPAPTVDAKQQQQEQDEEDDDDNDDASETATPPPAPVAPTPVPVVVAPPAAQSQAAGQDPKLSSLSLWSATPGQRWLLHVGIGLGTQTWPLASGGANATTGHTSDSLSFGGQLWYRITDRLSWNVPFPAFSYRFGNPGKVEVITSMGLKLNSWSSAAGPSFGFSTGANALIWTTPNQRITLGAGVYMPAYGDTVAPLVAGIGIGNDIDPSVRAGYSWTTLHLVTLHAEVGYVQNYYRGVLQNEWVQPRGGVDIRLTPNASLNLGVLYSDEVKQNLGSYTNFSVGTTLAF